MTCLLKSIHFHLLCTVMASVLRAPFFIAASAMVGVLAGCSQAPTTTAPAEKPAVEAPAAEQASGAKVGDNCFIDTQKRTAEKLAVVGWAFGSLSEAPKSIAVKVVSGDKSSVFPATFYERPDIVKAFKSPALLKAGFNADIPAVQVPSGSELSLLVEDATGSYICKNVFKAQ